MLAGEEPIDHTQKAVLREGQDAAPDHGAGHGDSRRREARHISFAHEYLHKRVPNLPRRKRFALSLYVPIVMRVLASAILVPPRAFWKEFDIPRSVRRTSSSAHRPHGSGCRTCSPTFGCSATTPG